MRKPCVNIASDFHFTYVCIFIYATKNTTKAYNSPDGRQILKPTDSCDTRSITKRVADPKRGTLLENIIIYPVA